MITSNDIELIDYFIRKFREKENFNIKIATNKNTCFHFYLEFDVYKISIGYSNIDKRIELYSFGREESHFYKKLFSDVIILKSKKQIDEIMKWLSYGGIQ